MKKIEVICVYIDDRFQHHRQLKIGDKYLMSVNNDGTIYESPAIYTSGGKYIGHFFTKLFMTTSQYRAERLKSIMDDE